ncbi:Lysine-specific demethylase JMJ17 [Linum grandiflorum]
MGKGKPRAVEKGVLGSQNSTSSSSSEASSSSSLDVPPAPVYYPTEEEFKDPLEYIHKIRNEAERYGICRIVPPKGWSPPLAMDMDRFSFPTKTQAIHLLQARPASCDSETFELEYTRFLEEHCGRKVRKKRVVFEGEDLDLCKLFNAVKRFGGYDKVLDEKKWGEVSRFVNSGKVSECGKHVLCQLYREHLYDYEMYYNVLNKDVSKGSKRKMQNDSKSIDQIEFSRSKRRRKNANGANTKVCEKVVKEENHDQICKQCRSGLHGELMLLCDRCNKGWHIYCLSPPLKQIPPGNWYCFECLNSDKDSFGFVPGKEFMMDAFKRVADRAKRKWFGSEFASRSQIETKFWEIVEGLAGEVEVMYGSDLDTSVYGSGFPRLNDQRPESVDPKSWDEYCASPWNLNNLPKLKGSMLQAVHQNITGVMVPWLYVGMLFSAFCWHFEDHCFYSMNYLHWGEPKCWYSIPGNEAGAFEKVMKESLPDLFDAQPDLLFQLVTMLNPSVLQEKGVPVYSILQEPGNFVITFPRSYHGGFNCGLNCAEAVNFAPADWLPHGGFGAKLYQMYHKPAVLSHEELLCVVAKGDYDSKASPHLMKELLRVYTKEKTLREKLWRSGIVRTSCMPTRKCPEYVGTEEDSTCVICKQYLYLSAVSCRCRRSAFVCLEHWERLCECKPIRRRLLYRHTLAELHTLVLMVDKRSSEERPQSNSTRKQISYKSDLNVLTKKVKGVQVSLPQLAEQWLLQSCSFLENQYCRDTCLRLLKEAEQFLWAASEMDPVRDVLKRLIAAKTWSEGINDCLCKIQNWTSNKENDLERVHMEHVNELLTLDPVPCEAPGRHKLQEHADEARLLIRDIETALSSCLEISDLECVYSRACEFPIYVKESEKLAQKVSSAKVWLDQVRKALAGECVYDTDVDSLHRLKSEILELEVQLPEAEMLSDLIKKAELCQIQCSQALQAPLILKDVAVLIQEFGNFIVNVPELMILKQYHAEAVSWISRRDDVLMNTHEREDQNKVIEELNCLVKDRASLRISVDGLPLLETELKKACWREKALKAHQTKMPLEFIQQLVADAAVLQIEKENIYVLLSDMLAAALSWEEKAKQTLVDRASLCKFEDLIRSAADISVLLPSLDDVKCAVSMANCWLKKASSFVDSSSSAAACSNSSLKLVFLKDLLAQSDSLKVSLTECKRLQMILRNCEDWQQIARPALCDAECVLNVGDTFPENKSVLESEIRHLHSKMESILLAGSALRFDLPEIVEVQNASSTLQWCARALFFCSVSSSCEDVQSLIEDSSCLSVAHMSSRLCSSLIDGVKWLLKALEVMSLRTNFERCSFSHAEEVLAEYQCIDNLFPIVVDQLAKAILTHKQWKDRTVKFRSLGSGLRSWSEMLELKDLGRTAAFGCRELESILSEVEKVEDWKQQCAQNIEECSDDKELIGSLQKIIRSLDLSLSLFGKSERCSSSVYMCCVRDEGLESIICSSCNDCYHLECLDPDFVHSEASAEYMCRYCKLFSNGIKSPHPVIYLGGRQAELKFLTELLSISDSFSVRIVEVGALQEIVEKALMVRTCLREVLEFLSSCTDNDLKIVSEKLAISLKAIEVAGIHDHEVHPDFQLALSRHSWRVRVDRILVGGVKPTLQEIHYLMEEALTMDISSEDNFTRKLSELNDSVTQWVDRADKVSNDHGALALDKVFELILEVENLPIILEEELKMLRDRSMLYCICRTPLDDRPTITCTKCEELYHKECIKLTHPRQKMYICPACITGSEPEEELEIEDDEQPLSSLLNKAKAVDVEPKTPSPRPQHVKKRGSLTMKKQRRRDKKTTTGDECSEKKNNEVGIDRLWWQNRKPFRRAAKKRTQLQSLSQLFVGKQ